MTLPTDPRPLILHNGEGRSVEIGAKTRCTFKVVGEETADQLALFEYEMEPVET